MEQFDLSNKMAEGWDAEVAARLELLKCRACGGVNPYICKCAKMVWLRQQEAEEKRKKPKIPPSLDEEWAHFKALAFPADTRQCFVCNTGEMRAFCACAKKEWMENKKGAK